MTMPTDCRNTVGLVVAAAGRSRRYGGTRNKLLEPLHGRPVFIHCLESFATVVPPRNTVLVVPADQRQAFAAALEAADRAADIRLVDGGSSRAESVLRGLRSLPASLQIAAVQDAARPLSSADLLRRCIASAIERGSGVAARPVTDTIKDADPDGRVRRTLQRSRLWAAETPQVFERTALLEALDSARRQDRSVTDEAQAFEESGQPVYLVTSSSLNLKITRRMDLDVARGLPHDDGR